MRSLGPPLILGGALGAAVAMFLPVYGFGGEDWTWWEYLNGLDIALLVSCVITTGFALAAVTTNRPRLRQMAVIGGAMTFGLAFAFVPGAIDDSHYRAGLWIVASAGAVALAGALVTALSGEGQKARLPSSSPRWPVAGIGITGIGVIAFATMAVADPFGGTTRRATSEVPDVNDAAKANTRVGGRAHAAWGKSRSVELHWRWDTFQGEVGLPCTFRTARRVVTVYVRTKDNLREQEIVQVRSGEHPLPYP